MSCSANAPMGLKGDWERGQGTSDQAITPVELGGNWERLKGLQGYTKESGPARRGSGTASGLGGTGSPGITTAGQTVLAGRMERDRFLCLPAQGRPVEWEESSTKEQHPLRLLSPERAPTNPYPYSPCSKVSQFRPSLYGPGRHFWNCRLDAGA